MEDLYSQSTPQGQQAPLNSQKGEGPAARYIFIWRSEGLTANAKTIDEMIDSFEGAADALRLLKNAGVVLDADASIGDNACLITSNPAVAQRFEFQQETANQETQDDISPACHTECK